MKKLLKLNGIKTLNKKEQFFIKGKGPAAGGSGGTGCTGDVDGDPSTTWDRYCEEGEEEDNKQ